MKTLLLIVLSLNGFSQETKKIDSSSEIGAQTNITQAAIDQLLRKLDSQGLESNYNISDYRAQYPLFKRKVELGLDHFKDQLTNAVLKKLSFWIDRYNQTYYSTEYSAQQKGDLLKSQYNLLLNQASIIEKTYHSEIKKLYQLVQKNLIQIKTPTSTNERLYMYERGWSYKKNFDQKVFNIFSEMKCDEGMGLQHSTRGIGRNVYYLTYIKFDILGFDEKISDLYSCSKSLWSNFYAYFSNYHNYNKNNTFTEFIEMFNSGLFQNLFNTYTYPEVSENCSSSLCMGLKQNDMIVLLSLIGSSFDRNIELKLADGKSVVLKKSSFNPDLIATLLSYTTYPKSLDFEYQGEKK